jgi:hypothetical protein
MSSAIQSDVRKIQELLIAKSNPNAQDASGWTALVYAMQGPSNPNPENPRAELGAVRLLLKAGADPNAQSLMNQTPIVAAMLAYDNPLKKMRMLIDAKANLNAQDKNGRTALMTLATRCYCFGTSEDEFKQRVDLFSLLRSAGARTDLKDSNGLTVFDLLEQEMKKNTQYDWRTVSEIQAIPQQYARVLKVLGKRG